MTATYPPNLQTIISLLLFCVSKFKIFDFFLFVFVKMEPYGRKISNDISHLKVHMRFTPKISCIVSTKVLQRIVKFEILDFCPPLFFFFFFFFFFCLFSLTWDHMPLGEKNETISLVKVHTRFKIQTISPVKVHTRFISKELCIPIGMVSTKVVKRMMKF